MGTNPKGLQLEKIRAKCAYFGLFLLVCTQKKVKIRGLKVQIDKKKYIT